MIAPHKMAALYGGLQPTERARLMARVNRTGDYGEMNRIGDSLPEGQAAHYNRRLHILRSLHSPLAPNLVALLLAAERDAEALRAAVTDVYHDRLRHFSLGHVWKLVPYPVTESEYAVLRELDRARIEPLDDFAGYMVECLTAEQAQEGGWRPEVVAFLARETEWSDEEWRAQGRRLLDAAVAACELPQPVHDTTGPALPWGVLMDWLEPGQPYEMYGPSYHVPTVELLGGDFHARWEICPDSGAEAVHARREQIADALFSIAMLERSAWPSIHPPATRAEQLEARRRVEAGWPRLQESDDQARCIQYVGAEHAQWRAGLDEHMTILDEICAEDFGGEDPLSPDLQLALEQTQAAYATVDMLWATAGKALRMEPGAWPELPTVPEEQRTASLRQYRYIFRDGAEAT